MSIVFFKLIWLLVILLVHQVKLNENEKCTSRNIFYLNFYVFM